MKRKIRGSTIFGAVVLVAFFGWLFHSHSQSYANVKPTQSDYQSYYNNQWIWHQSVDNSSKIALKLYGEYGQGQLPLSLLHTKEQHIVNVLENLKSSYTGAIPKSYQAYDKQASNISSRELSGIKDLASMKSDAGLSGAQSLLQNGESKFATLQQSFPKP